MDRIEEKLIQGSVRDAKLELERVLKSTPRTAKALAIIALGRVEKTPIHSARREMLGRIIKRANKQILKRGLIE